MNILTAEKLNMSYSEKILLKDVSLYIEHNDKIGVIGINGTGKSTLLKILAGEEIPLSGTVTLNNGLTVSYLPQNPEFHSDKSVLEQVLTWASEKTADEVYDFEAKTILTKLGITEFDKPVNLLSGGQKKRVAIAAALLYPSNLLILDEPTNHLDLEMVSWLEEMLKKYNGAIVMITHDRYFLDRVSNRIIEIDRGNLYSYKANYSAFLTLKAEREEMDLASDRKRHAILKKELAWMQRGARARSTKAKGRIEAFHKMSEIEDVSSAEKLNLSSVSTRLGRKIIEIDNISKSFDGNCLIKDFSLILERDSRIGIIGKNGCGKSTLLNMITGKLLPDSGEIVRGETVKIGYFSQECEEMDLNLRVIDYIKNVAEYIKTVDGELSASQMLEKFLFPSEVSWNVIGRLSGGERRRLFLLRILMDAPNILLLDEPTNDLDIETLSILEDYLEGFSGAVITVSHDRYFLDKVVNRIFTPSKNGEVLQYLGGYSDYLEAKIEEIEVLEPKKVVQNLKPTTPKKLKFSFNEQREFDTIDDVIEQLENKIANISVEISKQTSDFTKLNELLGQKEQLESELDEKIERWTYLNDLAEKIANS
ncbi:MAG: ABC-F family ATP-binding cassette domain-containing protein [Clostridia bacterium]